MEEARGSEGGRQQAIVVGLVNCVWGGTGFSLSLVRSRLPRWVHENRSHTEVGGFGGRLAGLGEGEAHVSKGG